MMHARKRHGARAGARVLDRLYAWAGLCGLLVLIAVALHLR